MRVADPKPPSLFLGPPAQDVFAFVGDTTIAGGWTAFEGAAGDPTLCVLDTGDQGNPPAPVTSVGPVTFCPDLERHDVPAHWATWSHGYMNEIFVGCDNVVIEFDRGVTAFDAYIQPDPFTPGTSYSISVPFQ